ADGLVVVEAAARSGALNTAGWAGDLGIPVMAFPGEVDRPKAAGCLALIRDGAILVRGPDDVLAELGIGRLRLPAAPVLAPDLAPLEQALLAGLADGELGIDALVARCAAPPATVVAALGRLEIEGHIARSGPATFIRVQTRTWSPGR
ncbi:MAG: DNA-processing protein DprA, partial [Vulcanimicrobiaceae bacterium]